MLRRDEPPQHAFTAVAGFSEGVDVGDEGCVIESRERLARREQRRQLRVQNGVERRLRVEVGEEFAGEGLQEQQTRRGVEMLTDRRETGRMERRIDRRVRVVATARTSKPFADRVGAERERPRVDRGGKPALGRGVARSPHRHDGSSDAREVGHLLHRQGVWHRWLLSRSRAVLRGGWPPLAVAAAAVSPRH